MGISLDRNFWLIPVKFEWELQVWVSPWKTPEHVCEHSPLSWLGSEPHAWNGGTWLPKTIFTFPFILQMNKLRPRKVKGWTEDHIILSWGQNPGFIIITHHPSSCHWSEDSKRPAPSRTGLHPFPLLVPRLACWLLAGLGQQEAPREGKGRRSSPEGTILVQRVEEQPTEGSPRTQHFLLHPRHSRQPEVGQLLSCDSGPWLVTIAVQLLLLFKNSHTLYHLFYFKKEIIVTQN